MQILIATRNPGKFAEIKAILADVGMEFFSPADLGITEDFDESAGTTYEENALGKARFYGKRAPNMLVVADDSGIKIDALKGELGVKTRRWGAGENASDQEWMDFFMNRMKNETNRKASFVCFSALRMPDGREFVFSAETRGEICHELKAPMQAGVPLSSVFLPENCDTVYSAMSEEEKNSLSHRGRAFAQLLTHLKTNL